MFAVAQRAYPIQYEARRLATVSLVGVGLYAASGMVVAASGVPSLILGLVAVGIFPFMLMLFGFLHRHELADLRAFLNVVFSRGSRAAESADRDPTMQ